MDVIFDNLEKWFLQLYKPPPPPPSIKNKIITVTLVVTVGLYIYNYWNKSNKDRCWRCNRTNLVLINNECVSCRNRPFERAAQAQSQIQPRQIRVQRERIRPLFGQYKCSCGRRWASRRSWQGRYQVCKECRKEVYAHTQRELLPTDMSRDRDNSKDHQENLCQMCKEVGYYCGKFRD